MKSVRTRLKTLENKTSPGISLVDAIRRGRERIKAISRGELEPDPIPSRKHCEAMAVKSGLVGRIGRGRLRVHYNDFYFNTFVKKSKHDSKK